MSQFPWAGRPVPRGTRTHTGPSRISHAVRKLTEGGWVERRHCEDDRRSWFPVLTGQGRELLRDAGARHVRSMREYVFDVLTPEQQGQLLDIGRTLLGRLDPDHAADHGARVRSGPQEASA